jgi:predicted aspartyl protease
MLPQSSLPVRLAICLLAICDARADDSGYLRIDLTRNWQNHMLAPVRLNGRTAHLLVDTGAVFSCVDLAKERSFGFRPEKGMVAMVNGRKYGAARIDSLGIGPVEMRNLKVALINASEYETRRGSDEVRVDGILGLDVLRLGHAVLDCRQPRLFWKAIPSAPNLMAATLRAAGWTAVKLELKDNLYFANGTVNETPARFVVDTGAFVTLVDRNFAARAGLKADGLRLRTKGIHHEDTQSRVAHPTTLAIGGLRLRNYPVAISALRKPGLLDDTVSGLLGADVLGRNLGVIDCEQHVLYLKSPDAR